MARQSPYQLSAVDDTLLRFVFTYPYSTAEQLTRLRWSPGSLKWVREKLKVLTNQQYLQRCYLPRLTRGGDQPAMYRLGRKGLRAMRDQGYTVTIRYRPSEGFHDFHHLKHTQAVNDFLIAATRLTGQHPSIELAGILHDLTLQRRPIRVTTARKEHVSLVPDGWLDFRLIKHRVRRCVVLELDRGTEDRTTFRRKIAAYSPFHRGPYQEVFGATSMILAIATTAGEKRITDLMTWCAAELHDLHDPELGSLLRFMALPQGVPDPTRIFLAPSWRALAVDQPLSLLYDLV